MMRDHTAEVVVPSSKAVEDVAYSIASEALREGLDVRKAPSELALSLVSALIGDLTVQARQVLRQAVRAAVVEGLNPHDTARLIEHVIPLSRRGAAAVLSYRKALQTGSTRALSVQLRDKRSDAVVERGGLTETKVDALTRRYSERMVRYRATVIARTESLRIANQSQWETMERAEREGRMPKLVKKWLVARDERLCQTCRAIGIMNADGVPLREDFRKPDGSVFLPPEHPQCRCTVQYSLA